MAAGVPVGRYKLQVFALSAGYAGLAGGVYAFYVSYIAPGSFPLVLVGIMLALPGGVVPALVRLLARRRSAS